MLLTEFDQILRNLLLSPHDNADGVRADAGDSSLNGVQVGRSDRTVERVAVAVDACMETFRRAQAWQADALFVHHGLFWGRPLAITGAHFERVRYLIDNDLALYAMHLPLDCHPSLGNNAGMAAALGLEQRQPFGEYRGAFIGISGSLPAPCSLDQVATTLFGGQRQCLAVLPFGPEQIRTVALVSGGGTRELETAIAAQVDLFVTGDASHQNYHTALEAGINVISGGHYLSEVYGVRSVGERLARDLPLQTTFIEVDTGL